MKKCEKSWSEYHDFKEIRYSETPEFPDIDTVFIVVVCVYCGQVRRIDEEGTIEIFIEEGKRKPINNEPEKN